MEQAERVRGLGRFKPYPAYKGSGVDWLGEIPARWEVRRLKTIASVQLSNVDKKSVDGELAVRLCNSVDVYYNEHVTGRLDFMAATATQDQVRRFSLGAGDVLITKDSESWTDIAVPAVVTEDLAEVLCGYHLAHIRPEAECHGPFLSRAFSAVGPRDQFQVMANGITRFGLGGDAIRIGLFAIPPVSEQRAIAAFLDRETAKIDTLVAKKERLIELLQEKRTALITRAVTKGLAPDVPRKDSGVEWLGEIPTHWDVTRLKHVVPGLTVGIVVTPAKYYVLVVRTGQAGIAAIVPKELDGANCIDLLIVRRSDRLRSRFVYYYLNCQAAISQAELRSVGAIQSHSTTPLPWLS